MVDTIEQGPDSGSPVELEDVPCALCSRRDATPIIHATDVRRHVPGEFTVVRCRQCGLVYVNPRPTPRAISRYYPADYTPHQLLPPSLVEKMYYRLFRQPPARPGARVLDVGCGGGKYLRFLRDRGYAVAGVEVNEEVVRRLRSEAALEVYPGLITDAPIADRSFDVVTLWWVLEHTHDPVGTLRAARRILKPGGTVVVALQNFAAIGRLLFGAHWHHLDVPGHLYQFEPATLRKMLSHVGFTSSRVRQDLLAKDLAPSFGYWLGLRQSLDRALLNGLTVPLDFLAWGLRRSGLITAYAVAP